MKKISFMIVVVLMAWSCRKQPDVTSIDQVPGLWRWESTCGGVEFECTYGSKANYATIEFKADGRYIEKHNDTVFLQTNYTLINIDDILGTLILENPSESRPVTLMDNILMITRGSFIDSYSKMRK